MAITIDFSKEFSDLICTDIPLTQCESYPNTLQLLAKYRKTFVHTPNGFANLFCEEYSSHDSYWE